MNPQPPPKLPELPLDTQYAPANGPPQQPVEQQHIPDAPANPQPPAEQQQLPYSTPNTPANIPPQPPAEQLPLHAPNTPPAVHAPVVAAHEPQHAGEHALEVRDGGDMVEPRMSGARGTVEIGDRNPWGAALAGEGGPPPDHQAQEYPPPDHPPPEHEGRDEEYAPPAHPPPSHHTPDPPAPAAPTPPPRPALDPSSEIYSIKHVDLLAPGASTLSRYPILTQNFNGPCPLMALVNALTLSTPPATPSAVITTLRNREQISLSLLLAAVFDELTSHAAHFPDVDQLSTFLRTLHTGMTVNPRFDNPTAPGSFEPSPHLDLYTSFAIPLVHGWLPDPTTPHAAALARAAPDYDSSQTLLSAEDDLTLPDARADAALVREFLDASATQLTAHGLHILRTTLPKNSPAILFRNDHFATILRRDDTLYALVTDAGFARHPDVVWERLADVTGAAASFHAGDFRRVGETPPEPAARQRAGQDVDADLALALSLQEEEERGAAARRGEGRAPPPLPPREGEMPPPYGAVDAGSPSVARRPVGLGRGGAVQKEKEKKSCVVM